MDDQTRTNDRRPPPNAATHLALLRGINLGGKNKLPMKDLVAIFVAAGCHDVRTYIQSGNVIFDTTPSDAAQLPDRVSAQIAECFGYRIPVVLRTADQFRSVVSYNPFLTMDAPVESLHVMFLATAPSPDRVAALDPDRSPPDAFAVRDQEVYLRLPNGAARSKLTNSYFDTKLATTSTARNWRTVTQLLALMDGERLS